MKFIFSMSLIVLISSVAFAQEEKLPNILKPDADLTILATSADEKIFKLLPRGMFADGKGLLDDEGSNPLGIRGGGAYYSFTTDSHSYNKIPQIELQGDTL